MYNSKTRLRLCALAVAVAVTFGVHAQSTPDTTAIIKQFNDVMAFSVQPNLYYTTTTTVRSVPALRSMDSAGGPIHGVFYKKGDDLYYGNEREELFLQDSLLIRVSHQRKMVQVGRVDTASKKKMDLLPLKRMDTQKVLRGHYTISQSGAGNGNNRIAIVPKAGNGTGAGMSVDYNSTSNLPVAMDVKMNMRQPASPQLVESLKKQGDYSPGMLQQVDGRSFLVIENTVHIDFLSIDTTAAKASRMPLWTGELSYDAANGSFVGKGKCAGYEVVKTF